MSFVLSKKRHISSISVVKIGDYFIEYDVDSVIAGRLVYVDTPDWFIFGDVNVTARNLVSGDFDESIIETLVESLTNGYILVANKHTTRIALYNDIYGYYHVYYCKKEGDIVVSSDFNSILVDSNHDIDPFAFLDILLFNYTLLDRTLLSDIKRLVGGSLLTILNFGITIVTKYNFAINFKLCDRFNITPTTFGEELVSSINSELINSFPVCLTMTGGFDSRAILASCSHLRLKSYAFTFGQEGNIEYETIKSFINKYVERHTFIKLDKKYTDSIESIFERYLVKNLDNPVFHSLVEYEYASNYIPPSNLILGFMGGEFIVGQSLGSQVTFTKFAKELLLSSDKTFIRNMFFKTIRKHDFVNIEYISSIADDYLESLNPYRYKGDNYNFLQFMINEEFSKFFGAVNKVFKGKYNIITPFMSVSFLELLLNSQISFLRNDLRRKHWISSFRSKTFYAKAIKSIYPPIAKTKLDRQYVIDDLCKFSFFPKVIYNYAKNHTGFGNKKGFTSTTQYDLWYKKPVVSELKCIKMDFKVLNKKYKLTDIDYENKDGYNQRDLLRLWALLMAKNKMVEI